MESITSVLSTAGIIIAVILMFNFMIFVHELGHFLAARWRGLYVDKFQIWFGKAIWKKKINGVEWGLGWIPAGGFVSLPQMGGMEALEGHADLPENLKEITPLDKIIVAAAGPIASFLLALFFALIVWGVGKNATELNITTVGYVSPGSPAAEAGILPGDKILKIDGRPVTKWLGNMEGVRELIMLSENEKITFTMERPGESAPIEVKCGYRIPESSWWERTGMRQVGIVYAMPCKVDQVMPHSPAARAGIVKGDCIVEVNGKKIWNPLTLTDALVQEKLPQMTVQDVNGNQSSVTFAGPQAEQLKTLQGVEAVLGVRGADGQVRQVTLTCEYPSNWLQNGKPIPGATPILGVTWDVSEMAVESTIYPTPWEQVGQSLKWMGETLNKLFASGSSVGVEHLSGPVGIANQFYKMFTLDDGWKLVLWFAVVLNVNLAVLNMLPLPVVDGGHVVINSIEWLFKVKIPVKVLEIVYFAFTLCMIFFFIYVTSKDVGDLVGGEENVELPTPQFLAK